MSAPHVIEKVTMLRPSTGLFVESHDHQGRPIAERLVGWQLVRQELEEDRYFIFDHDARAADRSLVVACEILEPCVLRYGRPVGLLGVKVVHDPEIAGSLPVEVYSRAAAR